jgi:hypothetical protein
MQLPSFPEVHEPSIRILRTLSDLKLLSLFQNSPDEGLYFVTIYSRYAAMTYVLVRNLAPTIAQIDYLFALTWRTIFHALQTLNPADLPEGGTLQSWLLDVTGICIHQLDIPTSDMIQYSLRDTPPPLWCYVDLAMEKLSPKHRLLLAMAHAGQWNATLMASYLSAEGETVTAAEIPYWLDEAYNQLAAHVPEDLRGIYL